MAKSIGLNWSPGLWEIFLPKEIAQFHTLLTESSLSATFTSEHEFLFAFNSRNKLVGGLYWKNTEKNRIHLEWVVIRKKYQKISLSKRLMSDLYQRMKHKNIEIIKVGFYAEKFFFGHGFALNNSYGGLVKELWFKLLIKHNINNYSCNRNI